jgi:HlyD family secretion protein
MQGTPRTTNSYRLLITTAALLALAGGVGGLLALSPKDEPKKAQRGPEQTADRATVENLAFEISTVANGDLQAKNQLELRSPLEQQTTIQFIVPEGTRVKAGDTLAQLNADNLQRSIDEERPRLASSRAQLVAAENQYQIQINDNASALRKAELQKDLALLSLNQWRDGDVVKRRQDLRLAITTAELELERLAQKFVRSDELLAEGFVSKDERDRDEGEYIRAIANYKTSQLNLDTYEVFEHIRDEKQKLSDVENAQDEVERVRLNNQIQLASRAADRENQREQVTLLESRLKKLEEQLASAKIVAPRDGLVVYSSSVESSRWGGSGETLQIGQQVYSNQLLMVLPDTSEMVAAVRVHESMAGRVKPGQVVSVKVDAAGGRVFKGTVESIGVMAESGGWRDPNLREYTVRIALDTEETTDLKPSMRGEARIVLGNVEEGPTVPVQALFTEGPVQFVYVPEGRSFVKRPVRVGQRSETLARVAAGVTEGETVLLRTPAAGEVLSRPWDDKRLADAGYSRDEQGNILAPRGGGPGGAGGPGRQRRTGAAGGQPADGAGVKPVSTPPQKTTPTSTTSGG